MDVHNLLGPRKVPFSLARSKRSKWSRHLTLLMGALALCRLRGRSSKGLRKEPGPRGPRGRSPRNQASSVVHAYGPVHVCLGPQTLCGPNTASRSSLATDAKKPTASVGNAFFIGSSWMTRSLPAPPESVTAAGFDGLTGMQSRFVLAFAELGGQRGGATEAALAAGYGNGQSTSAKARASELLRNPRVLAALRDELTRKLNAGAATGVAVLIELATDPNTPAATRLSAATQLVDRGHGVVASRFAHAHLHAVKSIEDVLAALDASDDRSSAN